MMHQAHSVSANARRGAPADERLSAYLAVEIRTRPQKSDRHADDAGAILAALQSLTPRIMKWDRCLWVLDLSVCESYWLARAAVQGCSAVGLVRGLLSGIFGQGVRAAMASHPWQAVLLCQHMRARRLTGMVTATGPFGENLYREISWDTWWTAADTLAEHLAAPGPDRRPLNPAVFRRQRQQAERAVQRIGARAPWQIRDISPLAMRRRFGGVVRDMWEWAYGSAQTDGAAGPGAQPALGLFPEDPAEKLFQTGFPWQSVAFADLPKVSRHLDVSLFAWDHIEPLLREDFDRLAGLGSWLAGEKVVSLEWCLTLGDHSRHTVPVRFRHPHSLHLEKGIHTTALLQALYSFERSMTAATQAADADIRYLPDMEITAWDLVVTERLLVPPCSAGLFGDLETSPAVGQGSRRMSHDEMSMLQLENRLPLRLEAYVVRDDWLPEDSYGLNTGRDAPDSGFHDGARMAVASGRPLYLYRRPEPFQARGRSSGWEFSERTMDKWWRGSAEDAPMQRDYYRMTDAEQKCFWGFRDERGRWFRHGVYG